MDAFLGANGQPIKQQQRTVYLGSVLCADGSSGSEMNRRIGAARDELDKLGHVWKHSGISSARKVQIFEACVMSRLLYNLHSLCLNTAELQIEQFSKKQQTINAYEATQQLFPGLASITALFRSFTERFTIFGTKLTALGCTFAKSRAENCSYVRDRH